MTFVTKRSCIVVTDGATELPLSVDEITKEISPGANTISAVILPLDEDIILSLGGSYKPTGYTELLPNGVFFCPAEKETLVTLSGEGPIVVEPVENGFDGEVIVNLGILRS